MKGNSNFYHGYLIKVYLIVFEIAYSLEERVEIVALWYRHHE